MHFLRKPSNIIFIKELFNIGEVLSMGIPIIANNIGDSGIFIKKNHLGIMLNTLEKSQIREAIVNIDQVLNLDPSTIRKIALQEYSLLKGIELYRDVYSNIFQKLKSDL